MGDKAAAAVDDLVAGRVVGFFTGRMEFGPRALGARSILFHTRDRSVNDWPNKRLHRTEFMPFAPVTPVEYAAACYVGWRPGDPCAPYMTRSYAGTGAFAERHPAVVHIDGTARGEIVGDRATNTAGSGEWGMGVSLRGCSDFRVVGTRCRDCWGGGFYLGSLPGQPWAGPGALIDVEADNNRRQGCSVVSARHVRIVRPRLTRTNGTHPQSGLLFEPNSADDHLEDVVVDAPSTADNAGGGVTFFLAHMTDSGRIVGVVVNGLYSAGDGTGVTVRRCPSGVSGRIAVNDALCVGSRWAGVFVGDCVAERGVVVRIDRATVIDPAAAGEAEPRNAAGVVVWGGGVVAPPVGGVALTQPVVRDTRPRKRMLHAIYIEDGLGGEVRDVCILDPLELGEARRGRVYLPSLRGGVVGDRCGVLRKSVAAGESRGAPAEDYHAHYDNAGATAPVTFLLDRPRPGQPEIAFEVLAPEPVRLRPAEGARIRPLAGQPGRAVEGSEVGARLTLRATGAGDWVAVERSGRWRQA